MSIEEADILIIGAGSAGSVLAARLSAKGLRILLIEAGEEQNDSRIADPAAWALLQNSSIDWAYRTIPQQGLAGRIEHCPRGKVVGGSSAIHAMGHMRGHPADVDAWAAAGATGWDWAALLPYFIRSETSPFSGDPFYGSDGPMQMIQPLAPHPLSLAHLAAGKEIGLVPIRDHNGARMDGPTLNTMTIKDGKRLSVSEAYLTAQVRARPNLRILTSITVDSLNFDDAGRVIGITGQRGAEAITLCARAGVILAAGAIGSPAILMRSGIGPANDLSALGIAPRVNLPGVGQNLQDHLLSAGNVYASCQPVPRSGTQHSESLTYIHAQGANPLDAPDLVVGICSLPILSEGLDPPDPVLTLDAGYTLMFGITHPRSRGSLTLTSADLNAAPRIDPAYLTERQDTEHFLEAMDWARRIGGATAYDAWRGEEIYPRAQDLVDRNARLAFIERAAITHHHPIGTCRMGTDANAVVHPDLSVLGVRGLYVVDGSLIPSLTTGPVNAAIIAVAERASDMLCEILR
jgi:choline dehydrogenase-like flavoprotein